MDEKREEEEDKQGAAKSAIAMKITRADNFSLKSDL